MSAGDDPGIAQEVRPALVAAWKDLPSQTQEDLIQFRWPLIAGPEMLPILRRMAQASPGTVRDAVLLHLRELDPELGRRMILGALQTGKDEPDLETVKQLSPEDVASVLPAILKRISSKEAPNLDYELVDSYADASALPAVRSAFEANLDDWNCASQSAMLRYFLRVDPEYGAQEVQASLKTRKKTHCYAQLLQGLGDRLPPAQQSAIAALDDPDPELAQDAVLALGRWGSADAEPALWARLQRFHSEWADRHDQLRSGPDYQTPASRGAALEAALVSAIGRGVNWLCPPDKLSRLIELTWRYDQRDQIETWINAWNEGPALISPWFQQGQPTFSLLQYGDLTEEQLQTKLAQLPKGTHLRWQFWRPGQIAPPKSMEKQDAIYEKMRVVAERRGVILDKINHDGP